MISRELMESRLAATERMAALPNSLIAAHLGVTDRTVIRYRKALGRPASRDRSTENLTHGAAGYNRGCRCDECKRVSRERHAEWMRNTEPLAADDPRHGTISGYCNWGCRCPECKAAKSVANRQQKENRDRMAGKK